MTRSPTRACVTRGAGADVAAAADGDAVADHGAGRDPRAAPDLRLAADDGAGLDDHVLLEPGGRMHRRLAVPPAMAALGRHGVGIEELQRLREARDRARRRPAPPCPRARARRRPAPPGRPRPASPPSWLRYLRLSRKESVAAARHRPAASRRGSAGAGSAPAPSCAPIFCASTPSADGRRSLEEPRMLHPATLRSTGGPTRHGPSAAQLARARPCSSACGQADRHAGRP